MSAVATVLAWLCILAGAGLVCGFWVYHHVAWPLTFPWRMRRAMVHLGLVGKSGHRPKLHRKRRFGRVWHLVWTMPTGTHTKVEGYLRELEAKLDCSLRVWHDRGKLHMRAGRGDVPELHMLAEVDPVQHPAPLAVHFGEGREGPIVVNLAEIPHLKVGGTSGGGKTAFVQSIVLQLAQRNEPDVLQFVLVDFKRVDLAVYRGLPHLRWPIAGRHGEAAAALSELADEQQRRADAMELEACPNVEEWNRRHPDQRMPYIVFAVDEWAEALPKDAKDDKEQRAEREAIWKAGSALTRLGRAFGIHGIIATQRPDADVLDGQIRANTPGAVAFFCADPFNSGILLGPGNDAASKLPCRPDGRPYLGRAIWKWGRQEYFQAAFMPARDIAAAVQELRGRYAPLTAPATPNVQPLPMRSVEEA